MGDWSAIKSLVQMICMQSHQLVIMGYYCKSCWQSHQLVIIPLFAPHLLAWCVFTLAYFELQLFVGGAMLCIGEFAMRVKLLTCIFCCYRLVCFNNFSYEAINFMCNILQNYQWPLGQRLPRFLLCDVEGWGLKPCQAKVAKIITSCYLNY